MFLQRLVEADELFGRGARGMRLGKEVLLESLGSDTTGITFRALSKGVLKSHQSILPHGDGAFLAIQLPLLGKKLTLQLNGHHN
jgi:hypothetical protein